MYKHNFYCINLHTNITYNEKLPVDGLKWVKSTYFTEEFIKIITKIVILEIYLKLAFIIPNSWGSHTIHYTFCMEEWKLTNRKKVFVIYMIRINYVIKNRSLKQALNHGLKLENVHRQSY